MNLYTKFWVDMSKQCLWTTMVFAVVPVVRIPPSRPQIASDVRDRKIRAIEETDAQEVASANPGCLLHLRSGGLEVRHPLRSLTP